MYFYTDRESCLEVLEDDGRDGDNVHDEVEAVPNLRGVVRELPSQVLGGLNHDL